MARLQILELPAGDSDDRPPFVLVVDQVPIDDNAFEGLRRDLAKDVASRIGARAVLVFEETVDIPANEVPIDPDGYPLKIRIEPDFEQFREQVEEEIRFANGKVTRALMKPARDWCCSKSFQALGREHNNDCPQAAQ